MPIIKNGKTVNAIYKGNKPIIKIFKGLQVVWEAFKKLLVSGIPPLRLNNSVGENLENYKIDGNSRQEAEPTPSNPKEVKSVGEKTLNLANIDEGLNNCFAKNTDGSYTLTKVSNNRFTNDIALNIPANTVFSIQATVMEYTGTYSQCLQITVRLEDGSSKYINSNVFDTLKTVTYDKAVVSFRIYSDNANAVGSYVTFKDFMVFVGDEKLNLFNKETAELGKNLDANAGTLYNSSARCVSDFIEVDASKQYIFIYNPVFTSHRYLTCYDKDKKFLGEKNEAYRVIAGEGNTSVRIAFLSSDVKYIRANCYWNKDGTQSEINDFKIYEGSASDIYEPFGYKIPTTVRSTNLFDVYAWYPEFVDEHGNLRYTNNDYTVIYRKKILEGKYKENTQYTFSVKYELIKKETINFGVLLHMILSDGASVVKRLPDKDVAGTYTGTCSVTNPVGTTVSKISLSYNSQDYPAEVLLWDMQIEEGATPTEYSPYAEPTTTNIYLDEPLRQVGEYKDYIDFENKKVVRNIYEYKITGNEQYYLCDTDSIRTQYSLIPQIKRITSSSTLFIGYLCSHNPFIEKSYEYLTTYSAQDPTSFEFRKIVNNWGASEYTVNAWKIFVQAEVIKGTPVTIDYVIETPTDEPIELPEIPTIKGTTILEIDTEIEASNMEVIYKGKG